MFWYVPYSELAMGKADGVIRRGLTWAAIFGTSLSGSAMAQTPSAEQREHAATLGAHHICSGVFVVGRVHAGILHERRRH